MGTTHTHRTEPRRSRLPAAATALLVAGLACGSDDVTAPAPPPPPASPEELLQRFSDVYVARDYAGFAALFPQDGLGVDYAFILIEPDPIPGDQGWGLAEELTVHRRMFDPMHPLQGESLVPEEYWIADIVMALTPIRAFVEASIPGLPSEWRAWQSEYHAGIVFDLKGPTDFTVDNRERFIVIENTGLPAGSPSKFLLYRWEELVSYAAAPALAGVEARGWGPFKSMYRR